MQLLGEGAEVQIPSCSVGQEHIQEAAAGAVGATAPSFF